MYQQKSKEDTMTEMNDAAIKAETDLKDRITASNGNMSATELLQWIDDWYLTAGYKRLVKSARSILGNKVGR